MSDGIFNTKEKELLYYYAQKRSAAKIWSFYFCVLFAPVLFAIYGTVNRDFVAVLVAFLGVLVAFVWQLRSGVEETKALHGIANKLIEKKYLSD